MIDVPNSIWFVDFFVKKFCNLFNFSHTNIKYFIVLGENPEPEFGSGKKEIFRKLLTKHEREENSESKVSRRLNIHSWSTAGSSPVVYAFSTY